MPVLEFTIAAATALGMVLVGGGLYETVVVDPVWPMRPDLVQPSRGGISRKRFWIPAHVVFELTLIASTVLGWGAADVRFWLLVALASHGCMRVWSAFDFIPKALAFEKAEYVDPEAARRWTRRSRLRIPLDLVTCFWLFAALWTALRG